MENRVVIVGGGLAGLAAAAALAPRGCAVTLLEARPRWGGRASSFVDQTTGETIDNCQHVSMGCCTNFRHFCQSVGLDAYFQRERRLWFIDEQGKTSVLRAAALPAPLHLAPAFVGLRFLSWHDKWNLARALDRLARTGAAGGDEPFLEWLKRHGQSPAAIDRYWRIVLVSALSETLDRIETRHARKVFADGFLAARSAWEVWLPTVPLARLYGDKLQAWLQRQGVAARLQCGVQRVCLAEGKVYGVELRGGEVVAADHVILAVPHHLAPSLLPDSLHAHPDLAGITRLETAPISSVHLWFDRPISPLRHATFIGRLSQWMFNRALIQQPPVANPGSTGWYYQVVISASREVVARPQEEVIRQVVGELAAIWPAAGAARLQHARMVTEHKAVVSMVPGVENLRPPQQSPLRGLQLAGDWTRTGWPSTMEGAVRSGYLAAENILRNMQQPAALVQPDLPVAILSKILWKL